MSQTRIHTHPLKKNPLCFRRYRVLLLLLLLLFFFFFKKAHRDLQTLPGTHHFHHFIGTSENKQPVSCHDSVTIRRE